MNVPQLIDLAKKNANLKSDQDLARALDVSHGVPYFWKSGKSLPSIEHAHQLAELAGLDPASVIADLLILNERDSEVIQTLERIKRAVNVAALPAILSTVLQCILCSILPPQNPRYQDLKIPA